MDDVIERFCVANFQTPKCTDEIDVVKNAEGSRVDRRGEESLAFAVFATTEGK